MAFNANFENSNKDITSTFDTMTPAIGTKDLISIPDQNVNYATISPVSSLLDDRVSAIKYTYDMFIHHPELFGKNAETLLYVQQAGHRYKPDQYYTTFEAFIKQVNKKYIADKAKANIQNIYPYDIDYLITWARVIAKNTPIEFEAPLKHVKAVFNDWMANQHVNYSGIDYPLSTFRCLCYTYSGENFYELLPYICYLFTFFIHCNPYEFCDGTSESSVFGFYRTIDNWFMTHYELLAKDYGIDIIKDPISGLQKIPASEWTSMYNNMFNLDQIIKLRNDEISRTDGLLEQCIQDQAAITYDYVRECFNNVLSNLITITIEQSPLKIIFDQIPRLDIQALDVHNLMMLTEYVFTGGDKEFCINSDYSYSLHADPSVLIPYPPDVLGKQSLKCGIQRLTIGNSKPFNGADLLTEMCISFIRDRFNNKRTDPLDPNPILINEDTIRNVQPDILMNLFVPGIWAYDNSTLAQVITNLLNKQDFLRELEDILTLATVTKLCYDNHQASIIITTLIMSYINMYLLNWCLGGYPLDRFRPMTEAIIHLTSKSQATQQRIGVLCNTVTSLMYLSDPGYSNFVNSAMTEFTKIMAMNPVIQQPYVKGLDDQADIYAIGGCDLYNYGKFANPLIRAYGFVSLTFGNSESLYVFYKHIEQLDNQALFDIINEISGYGKPLAEAATSTVETGLKSQYGKYKHEPVLLDFAFSGLTYKLRNTPYYLNLKTSDNIFILDLLCRYVFAYNNPHKAINRVIVMRPITYKNGRVTCSKPIVNGMNAFGVTNSVMLSQTGSVENVPLYDFTGSMTDTGIIWTSPNGYRRIVFNMITPRSSNNSTIWVFTNIGNKSRFSRYEHNKSGPTNRGILGTNRGTPDARRV